MSAFDLAGGVVSAIGNIIGGKMSYDAQKRANETNLQIAKEYNEAQREIAASNNDLQYRMFNESNYYNSPVNQRAMLEAAGYNPYSLYTSPSAGVASSQSLPNLQQPQFAIPTVTPESAFGSALQSAASTAANTIKTLADAHKSKSESDVIEIQKQTLQQRLIAELESLGYDNEAKLLSNEFASRSLDSRIKSVDFDNMLKDTQNSLLNQNLRQSVFDYELARTFGFKLKQKEFEKLSSEIELNNQKSITESVEQFARKYDVDYKSALLNIDRLRVKIEQQRANTERYVAETNRRFANANIANLNVRTGSERLDNDLKVARNRIIGALMKTGNDPISNMLKRDVWQTSMTLDNLKLAQKMVRYQIENVKSEITRRQYQNIYDAIDLGIKAVDAAGKFMSKKSSSSSSVVNYDENGDVIGGQSVVNTSMQGLGF